MIWSVPKRRWHVLPERSVQNFSAHSAQNMFISTRAKSDHKGTCGRVSLEKSADFEIVRT